MTTGRIPSVWGGVLLLSGSCIGAGMLAVPVATAPAGFIPSLGMFILAWLFMLATGLLLLEANLRVGHQFSLISLSEKTLGKWGKRLCWFLFLFLFYSIGVAYIAASGSVFHSFCIKVSGQAPAPWMGSIFFTVVFGVLILIGTRTVDYMNRVFMVLLFGSYIALLANGFHYVNAENLQHQNWNFAFFAFPILVVCFGFHNMIPSLAHYYHGDRKKLTRVIFLGSLVPLLVYILWQVILLGILPLKGPGGLIDALKKGEAATSLLSAVVGCSKVNTMAQLFALSAIVTSFLAQSLSLVDFLSDGLKLPKKGGSFLFLVVLALLPSFLCAFLYPGIFIKALNWAGGFAAVILFGCLPVMMVWKIREEDEYIEPILKGGKRVLILVFVLACTIFLLECAQELGLSPLNQELEAVP
jgi:tyrosine-specific transport protein